MSKDEEEEMTEVQIPAGRAVLSGNLTIPQNAIALVLFAHGSGSSRHSPRNQFVARTLNRVGLATLLFDLLTPEEEALDIYTREHRFNIGLLAERLVHATKWTRQQEETRDLHIGYFGSSTGGAAALVAAAETSTGHRCGRFAWWASRSCWRCLAKSPSADIAYRRRQR